jgi:hypothetical protein
LSLPKEGKAVGRNKEKRRISGNKPKTERFGEWTACCGEWGTEESEGTGVRRREGGGVVSKEERFGGKRGLGW